jgi:four helix bundle protein
MTREEMRSRTQRFAVEVIRFGVGLPKSEEGRIISRQWMRAATSVGANCRAAQRGRSRGEFVAKLGIVEEEADETLYWLELLGELRAGQDAARQGLHGEATEPLRIVIAAKKGTRSSP